MSGTPEMTKQVLSFSQFKDMLMVVIVCVFTTLLILSALRKIPVPADRLHLLLILAMCILIVSAKWLYALTVKVISYLRGEK